jgi:hypothetical protein
LAFATAPCGRRGALAFGFAFPFACRFAFGIVYSPAFAAVTATR